MFNIFNNYNGKAMIKNTWNDSGNKLCNKKVGTCNAIITSSIINLNSIREIDNIKSTELCNNIISNFNDANQKLSNEFSNCNSYRAILLTKIIKYRRTLAIQLIKMMIH